MGIRFALALAVLVWLTRSGAIEMGALDSLISGWRWALAGLAAIAFSIWTNAYRLPVLLRAQHFELDLASSLRLSLLGMFFNLALPGGVGGDAARIYYATLGNDGQRAEIGSIVIVERLLGFLAMLASPLLILPFFPGLALESRTVLSLIALSGAGFLAGCLGIVLCFRVHAGGLPWLERGLARLTSSAIPMRMIHTVGRFRTAPAAMAAAFGLGLISNIFAGVGAIVLLAAAIRPDLVGPGLALGAPLAFLANMLPLTPWGIGVGETALASLLRLAGHQGGGELMLAWRMLMLVPALCGAVVYLRGQKRWVRSTGYARAR
jgi:uncharacterized membrane protein YbhN (UPF0104 family)